ncbi:MAG: beta-galactosidase, partial [Verrucomicrobiota bacterium]
MKSALLLFLAAGMALGAEAPINRHALVTRHNLEWNNLAGQIPLGNGEFCFNADATGLQTFGGSTMSHWAWHSAPLPPGCTPADLPPTGTVEKGRITGPMRKASEHRELDGWMFRNPHPINLGRLRFLRSTGAVLEPKEIGSISRRYDLWTGMHTSRFEVDGQPVVAETCVHPTLDLIAVHAESPLLRDGKLVVALDFPYPSANNSSRWTGDKRPVIRSSSFMAPARLPGGAPMERPVFLTGYGHFSQVVSDMEKWPDYGVNIIQIELGPSRVFPNEGRTDEAPVRELSRMLDRAQKSGVAVCLLISPHYLPGWALEKWPQLRQRREGFLRYCLHAPEGRELLRRFILTALAPIKDHPALHSICLSNEPVNEEEPCEPARQQWRTWLEKRHGSITALNSLCGANFTAFAEVPLPNPFGPRPALALWMDYIRFNQEFFADWHRMLADAVHEVAPGLPVHAKAMTWTMINDGDVKYGVDATLFAKFSNINGNDSVNFFDFGDGEFARGWQLNAMGHDLQRSVLDAPVFNTENHLIEDRDTRYVPAAHVRAALWQAAVHGQSATAIWVWERTFDPKSDFAGSIMHRP